MRTRPLAFLLLWMSRYEQLAWGPLLLPLFAAAGDRDETYMAIAASAFSLANLAGNVLAGPALDRWGRYFLSGIGLLAMGLTAGLHLAVATPIALVSVRLLHGFSAAIINPASLAVVGDSAPKERRAEAMARAGIIIAFATMLGPAVSGGMERGIGLNGAVIFIAVTLAVSGLIAVLRGRQADVEAFAVAEAAAAKTSDDHRSLQFGPVLIAVVVAFSLFFAQNIFFYYMPLQARAMGLQPSHTGMLFGVFALASVFAFAPPVSRLGDRFGRRPTLILGLSIIAASLLFVSRATTPLTLALGLFAYGIGFGFTFPSASALSTDAAGVRRRGFSFGLFTAASSAGAFVGPLMTNGLRHWFSPYVVAGMMVAVTVVALAVWQEQRQASNSIAS